MTGCDFRRFEQFETSPETIEQELRPAVLLTSTDRFKENCSIDIHSHEFRIENQKLLMISIHLLSISDSRVYLKVFDNTSRFSCSI